MTFADAVAFGVMSYVGRKAGRVDPDKVDEVIDRMERIAQQLGERGLLRD